MRTIAEQTVIHAVGDTLFAGDAGNAADWKFSIATTGDHACHVFASPIAEGIPSSSQMVTITFSSMRDMSDYVEAELARKRLPEAVVAAILAAVSGFIIDAEIAYHTDQYLFIPD